MGIFESGPSRSLPKSEMVSAILPGERRDVFPMAIRVSERIATPLRQASGGDDDKGWKSEGWTNAFTNDLFRGIGRLARRTDKYLRLSIGMEVFGTVTFLGGAGVIGYATLGALGVLTTGLGIFATGGLILAGAGLLYLGYRVGHAGSILSDRVSGVQARISHLQALRRLRDFWK